MITGQALPFPVLVMISLQELIMDNVFSVNKDWQRLVGTLIQVCLRVCLTLMHVFEVVTNCRRLGSMWVARLVTPCHPHQREGVQNYTPPRRLILREMRKCSNTCQSFYTVSAAHINTLQITSIWFVQMLFFFYSVKFLCRIMTYVSILQSPARGSQSSGRTARPRARRLGRGTGRSRGEPEPRQLLSACPCPEPAFSPKGPQLKNMWMS